MTSTIAVYRDGRFTNEPKPDWWDEQAGQSLTGFRMEVGSTEEGLETRPVDEGHIVLLTMPNADFDGQWPLIWCPTQADYLAFLCGPGAAFVQAAAVAHGLTDLERIGHVLTSFARHGQGVHVDRDTGKSATDAAKDRARQAGRL